MQFSAPLRFALATIFAWLFLSLWRRERDQAALGFWGAAHCCWAAAAAVFALDGQIPAWLGTTLGNLGVALGYGLVWAGARRFGGQRAHPAGIAAGAAAWLLLAGAPYVMADFTANLPARVITIAAIVVAYDGAAAFAFLAGMRRQRLPSYAAAIGVLLAHAAVFALRGVVAAALPMDATGPLLPAATWTSALTILSFALTAGLTVLLVALAREQGAFASNAVLAAARDLAAAANAEKSRFLARMSHELRNPLNGVLGLAEALARDPALPPRQRDQVETLERAGRHLLAIVNDVLDLAKVEAGRLELAPVPVRLRTQLEEALELIEPAATTRRIELRLDLARDLPDGVLADPVRLRQVLLNLLGNAVKFTPEGGDVVLRAEPAGAKQAGAKQAGAAELRLIVIDSGPGIPAALRPRLFEEFAQGKQAGAGAGLGLAISAGLVRAMGGQLDFAPGPEGRGSAFTATLPLVAAAAPAPAQQPPLAVPGPAAPRPLRLLVVDDAPVNRAVVRALLRPEGHVIDEAADGVAALAALQRGPLPDLVLMDVNMPGMDGFQATVAIRALAGPAARVPVIALTGDAMPEAVVAGRAAGMDGHLTKPLRRAVLLAEIERLVPGTAGRGH